MSRDRAQIAVMEVGACYVQGRQVMRDGVQLALIAEWKVEHPERAEGGQSVVPLGFCRCIETPPIYNVPKMLGCGSVATIGVL